MTDELVSRFLQKAITKTKDGAMVWNKVQGTRSVIYQANILDGTFRILDHGDDSFTFDLRPTEMDPWQEILDEDDPSFALAVRLYRLVYSLFPNPEAFMESFISDSE